MVDFTQKAQYTVEDLRRIVALLRAPGGCPWDGAQTHESIRRNFIEEAYEVAEAIDEQSPAHLKEELGDVLLQVVFHASLEEDAGRFDLDDVADGICKKLIFRHPHVFGDGGEGTAESWEALKRREKGVAPELWEIDPGDAIPNHRIFRVRVGLFAAVVLLIATHTLTGLTMPSIGILAAGSTLCTTKYPWGLLKQVEWKTLGFLVGLFLTVSGLEQTGLLNGLAQVLAKLAGGHPVRTVVVLIWFVAIASAFVDNVPMAAVMVPVLLSLADTLGMDLQTLTWTVSKGTDIGGIATPIGASANVTGVAVAAREGAPIGWKRYCKYALPASVLVLLLSMMMILLMH